MTEWPTREQWAERERCAYWDRATARTPTPHRASRRTTPPTKGRGCHRRLEALWNAYGREMKAAKDNPVAHRPDESRSDHCNAGKP